MTTLNIGILAHIDAGKTSLTERILFDTGEIAELGSVDAGTSQTDTNEIERRRGITIRSAVAPFHLGALQVNIIDTPGHPDFIAEVERALGVLDGVVLVLSAVEGVQAQTRVLSRTLLRMGLPTLLFVNKVDRMGARPVELLDDIRRKLDLPVVAMNEVANPGTRNAHISAVPDGAWAVGDKVPVFYGSALTGEGVSQLLDGIERLLPTAKPSDEPLRGTVFAIDRASSGEKTAYVRLRAGELRQRQRVRFQRPDPDGGISLHNGRITALDVVGDSSAKVLTGGGIATLRGLTGIRVGDQLGSEPLEQRHAAFEQPRLETVVRPKDPKQVTRLHTALVALADSDPLIQTRAASEGGTSVLLYGEVQKEVIGATLAEEFGVEATFSASQPLYLERVVGVGEASEGMGGGADEFWATVGLRVSPGAVGSGVTYRLEVELGSLPLSFHRAVEETVRRSLGQGLSGWPVQDCVVTMTLSGYADAMSSAGDFRGVTPLVLMAALSAAGTKVCEPLDAFEVEVPADSIGPVMSRLASFRAAVHDTVGDGATWTLSGSIPARHVHELRQRLPGISHGEGIWISEPSGDRPVTGTPPVRETRTDGNPLNRAEYLRFLRGLG